MKELSELPEKRSVLEKLVRIVVQELGSILVAWVLKKLRPGAQASSPGATKKQALPNPEHPGAPHSSQKQE